MAFAMDVGCVACRRRQGDEKSGWHCDCILKDQTACTICIGSSVPGKGTMKRRGGRIVKDIVRPPVEGLPPAPAVGMNEPVTYAVELMLNNDRKQIAVFGPCGIIGYVRLEDALRHLGLRV
jgi:hypothetical protein